MKTALFFLAFLPQFLVAGGSVAGQLVVMGTLCVLVNTVVDVAAVLGASRLLRSRFGVRRAAGWMNKASGATLVGLGLSIAASRRSTV